MFAVPDPREFLRQMIQIGWLSLPVVGLTALFTGAALALQMYSGGERFAAGDVMPAVVAIGMARELGPVLGGLMVAARVASSIAAEIGTMRVTEQIDALVTLSADPVRHLVTPRIWAAILAVPHHNRYDPPPRSRACRASRASPRQRKASTTRRRVHPAGCVTSAVVLPLALAVNDVLR